MAEISRKGILLAGGRNTRLHPTTLAIGKAMLPIYDKPMLYYSLSSLMMAGIRDVLIITNPEMIEPLAQQVGDGSQWGMNIRCAEQLEPRGIADALLIAHEQKFLQDEPCALVLGDNIFYGRGLVNVLQTANAQSTGATVLAHQVPDPSQFGVVEIDKDGNAISLEEKPAKPKSQLAVVGCYFYDSHAYEITKSLKPSARGELEITDLNRVYMEQGQLQVQQLGRGVAWFDAGTFDSLADATNLVRVVQNQQNLMIACPEEIAFNNEWIDADKLGELAQGMGKNKYSEYLTQLAQHS